MLYGILNDRQGNVLGPVGGAQKGMNHRDIQAAAVRGNLLSSRGRAKLGGVAGQRFPGPWKPLPIVGMTAFLPGKISHARQKSPPLKAQLFEQGTAPGVPLKHDGEQLFYLQGLTFRQRMPD